MRNTVLHVALLVIWHRHLAKKKSTGRHTDRSWCPVILPTVKFKPKNLLHPKGPINLSYSASTLEASLSKDKWQDTICIRLLDHSTARFVQVLP